MLNSESFGALVTLLEHLDRSIDCGLWNDEEVVRLAHLRHQALDELRAHFGLLKADRENNDEKN